MQWANAGPQQLVHSAQCHMDQQSLSISTVLYTNATKSNLDNNLEPNTTHAIQLDATCQSVPASPDLLVFI